MKLKFKLRTLIGQPIRKRGIILKTDLRQNHLSGHQSFLPCLESVELFELSFGDFVLEYNEIFFDRHHKFDQWQEL